MTIKFYQYNDQCLTVTTSRYTYNIKPSYGTDEFYSSLDFIRYNKLDLEKKLWEIL